MALSRLAVAGHFEVGGILLACGPLLYSERELHHTLGKLVLNRNVVLEPHLYCSSVEDVAVAVLTSTRSGILKPYCICRMNKIC